MKKKIKRLIMIMIVILSPLYVEAHPGRTDSNGCHTCRTNCAKWGLSYGQYHCHGKTNSSTNTSSSNTNKTTTTKVLDSNKNIKSISIDNTNIEVNDTMEYNTYSKVNNIDIILESTKSKYEVSNYSNISIGDNNIKLNDGINNVELKLLDINDNVYKTYTLSIIKDSISSSNSDNKENTSNSDDAITTIFLIIISVIIYRKFKKKKHAKSQWSFTDFYILFLS